VAEVADNLAFSSPKYFAQRFKLKYGVTPRDYKGRKTDLSQQ
jgi:AraC-like DNA-binding protein